jgi:hypothetical protein
MRLPEAGCRRDRPHRGKTTIAVTITALLLLLAASSHADARKEDDAGHATQTILAAPDEAAAPAAGEPGQAGRPDGAAQTQPPPVPADQPADPDAPAATAVQEDEDDDMVLDPAQPDFTLVNLPTTLRLAPFKVAFRVTHRFNRPLGQGDFGDLLEDFFGLDAGALIGLELRVGLWSGLQAGIYRTSDRTIEFFTQYNVLRQDRRSPVTVSAWLTAEGTNNLKDSGSPGVGAILSRTIGEHAAVYAMPMWINNTNPLPSELADDNDTFVLGLGARVRVRPTVYLVGEVTPRLSGFAPLRNPADPSSGETDPLVSFGIEKRVGGHAFQLNFSNGVGSTMAQIARSFANGDDWFIGFNISRKFY